MEITFQPVLGKDLSSRLIAWYGQSYGGFSHIDCVGPYGELAGARSDYIGGKPPGVQVRPADYLKGRLTRRALLTKQVTDDLYYRWWRWIESEKGRQYDVDAIFGFLLGKRLHSAGHWICSAFAWESGFRMGLFATLPIKPSEVTPNSFVLLACQAGFSYREVPC